MKNVSFLGLLLASTLATGCAFEQTSKLFSPTAPSGNSGAAGSTSTGGTSTGGTSTGGSSTGGSSTGGTSTGGNSSSSPASAFAGAWGSPSIAGLPLGNCSNVKWLITTQTASSVSGTVNATCPSGVTVAATLTGTMQSDSVINLVTTGTMTAMGLPCQFNLTGTGTRQAGDTMRVNYSGSYCLGTLSGTETLRKFPNL